MLLNFRKFPHYRTNSHMATSVHVGNKVFTIENKSVCCWRLEKALEEVRKIHAKEAHYVVNLQKHNCNGGGISNGTRDIESILFFYVNNSNKDQSSLYKEHSSLYKEHLMPFCFTYYIVNSSLTCFSIAYFQHYL